MMNFSYTFWVCLKDGVQKEMPWGGFGVFVDACSLCAFYNIYYIYGSTFTERWKKPRGVGFKSSGEARVASPFNQW